MSKHNNPRPLQAARELGLLEGRFGRNRRADIRAIVKEKSQDLEWVSIEKDIVPRLIELGHPNQPGDKALAYAVDNDIAQMLQDDRFHLEPNWNDLGLIRFNPEYSYTRDLEERFADKDGSSPVEMAKKDLRAVIEQYGAEVTRSALRQVIPLPW